MRKSVLWAILLLAGVVVDPMPGQGLYQGHATFTAFFIEEHYDADGHSKSPYLETYSAWPDGSTVEVRHAVDGRPLGLKSIKNLGTGVSTVLDPETSSTTSYALSRSEVERATARTACSSQAPSGILLGFGVVAETATMQFGETRAVNTRKLAPALDCFPLYDSTVLQDDSGKTIARVTRIILAEPDRSALSREQNYIERKPSEVMTLSRSLRGEPGPQRPTIGASAALDQAYASRIAPSSGGAPK
jgi:hypothetical protein